jgi:hypothetical protein
MMMRVRLQGAALLTRLSDQLAAADRDGDPVARSDLLPVLWHSGVLALTVGSSFCKGGLDRLHVPPDLMA